MKCYAQAIGSCYLVVVAAALMQVPAFGAEVGAIR
jgi:hypothetical protein